jgi:hypothetical protein
MTKFNFKFLTLAIVATSLSCGKDSINLRNGTLATVLPGSGDSGSNAESIPSPTATPPPDINDLLQKLKEVVYGNSTDITTMKELLAGLENSLATEITERKNADKSLQEKIDAINTRIQELDAAISSLRSKQDDTVGLYTTLADEYQKQKDEYAALKTEYQASKSALKLEQEKLQMQLTALAALVASNKEFTVEQIAVIKADLLQKQKDYADLVADLATQREQTKTAISALQASQAQMALDLDTKFTGKIEDLSNKTDTMIESVYEGMAELNTRLTGVEGSVATLNTSLQALSDTVAKIKTDLGDLTAYSVESRNRIIALETFKKISQFCAAAGVSFKVIEKDLVALQSTNRSLFGPTTSAQFGYGNLFAKLSRFKRAEEVFDQYNYNVFFLDVLFQQVRGLQSSCSAMVAFPDRPSETGPYPVVGLTQSVVANGKPITWEIMTSTEMRRIMRLVPVAVQSEANVQLVSDMMRDYQDIFPSGQQLRPSDWDRHLIGLSSLVANGLPLLRSSVDHFKNSVINTTALQAKLPLNERAPLCRFGNGAAERSDGDLLRYASLEDGSVNGVSANWHLPQQFFYRKTGNDVFIAQFNYNLAMGPSATEVDTKFKDISGLDSVTTARQLLDTAEILNDFGKYPTTLERNISYSETSSLRNIQNICSPVNYSRDNFRSFQIKRLATIPFFKSGGCWNEMVDDAQSVCSSIAFRPTGDVTSQDPELRREVPTTAGSRPWKASEPIVLTMFNASEFPDGKFTGVSGQEFVAELFAESESSTWNKDNSSGICYEAGRFPFDERTGPHRIWTNLVHPYAVLGTNFYRDVTNDATVRFMIRSCRLCDTVGYSQFVSINGVTSNKHKLTFAPDFLFPIPGGNDSLRCSVTPSRCQDICQMIDRDQDGMPDGGTGAFKLYGNSDNPGSPLLRSVDCSTGVPWMYDQGAMLSKDRCDCTIADPPAP